MASADFGQEARARRDEPTAVVPLGSWRLAWRRLSRNPAAVAAALVLAAIVVACLCAPLFAGARRTHRAEHAALHGHRARRRPDRARAQARDGAPAIGPEPAVLRADRAAVVACGGGRYVLGADQAGHDVAVQLLYGRRSALEIGIGSSLVCRAGALAFGLPAGYRGGAADWLVSRAFDLLWAFPVLLLALALNIVLVREGWHRWGIDIGAGSILVPTLVTAFVRIPYAGRPLRGEALRSALAPR